MAFPTSTQTKADALAAVIRTAKNIKTYAQNQKAFLANNSASSNAVLGVMFEIRSAMEKWNQAKTVPGIGDYAKDQLNDPSLDIAAEFTNMVNAAQGVIDWIDNNFPKDANGYLLSRKIVNASIEFRQFTPAQTQGLRDQLDILIATIA